jgi:hypothetical protein
VSFGIENGGLYLCVLMACTCAIIGGVAGANREMVIALRNGAFAKQT